MVLKSRKETSACKREFDQRTWLLECMARSELVLPSCLLLLVVLFTLAWKQTGRLQKECHRVAPALLLKFFASIKVKNDF